MKSQRVGITAFITLLTTGLTPFNPNVLPLLQARAALSQPAPSLEHASEICNLRTQSMLPTVKINELVFIDQLNSGSQSPNRGDIIVFKSPQSMQQNLLSIPLNGLYIKRIIGLPGETVKVADGKVYINNRPLKEKYINEKPNYLFEPVTIPDNSYFVLGDNRNDSYDSHDWGFVPHELITGQVVRIVGPHSQLGQTHLKSALVNPLSSSVCNLY